MPNEPIQSLPYPAGSDGPAGPAQIKALADAVAPKLMMVFGSTAARDAAITSPVADMRCFVGSGDTMAEYIHNGTAWRVWTSPLQNLTVAPAGWSATGWGLFTVAKASGMVSVTIGLVGPAITTDTVLGVLPNGFRPVAALTFVGTLQGWTGSTTITINTDGTIMSRGTVSRTQIYGTVSFWAGL